MRIGIDVGGTKSHAVAIDSNLDILAEFRLPSGRGADGVLASTRELIRLLERELGIERGGFESLGIGIPGIVDFRSGVVSHAVNLEVESIDLAAGLAAEVTGLVRVDNDVNAAALGAYRMLGDAVESLAYLNVGTGLAAGLVIEGSILHGSRGVAGEIGHIPLDGSGVRCSCGQTGCLEAVASGGAVASALRTPDRTLTAAFDAASEGDEHAAAILQRLAAGIATAVQILALTLDPEVVVLGGGVLEERERLLPLIYAEFAARSGPSQFLTSVDLSGRLRLLPVGSAVAAIGAALLPTELRPDPLAPRVRNAVSKGTP
jgi:predicted NBD/HSP70 family sugar kinase